MVYSHIKRVAKLCLGCRLLALWHMELMLFTKLISFFAGLSGSSVLPLLTTLEYVVEIKSSVKIKKKNIN